MAGFTVDGRNKISYKVGSDGKVTVNVGGHPVGTFEDRIKEDIMTTSKIKPFYQRQRLRD